MYDAGKFSAISDFKKGHVVLVPSLCIRMCWFVDGCNGLSHIPTIPTPVQEREMEMRRQALEEERRRREELEKRLQEETSRRQRLVEREVKLREKQRSQVFAMNLV